MKAELIRLWKENFEDDECFIRSYFECKYSPDYAVTRIEDGRIVSSLLMLPYKMTYGNDILETSYISGASTVKSLRSKGYMGDLLRKALCRMYKNNVHFSILIPQGKTLFDYYGNFGYTPVFERAISPLLPGSERIPDIRVERAGSLAAVSPKKLYDFYDFSQKKYSGRILHDYKDFLYFLNEIFRNSGFVYFAIDKKDDVCGLAFFSSQGNMVYENETSSLAVEHMINTSILADLGKNVLRIFPGKTPLSSPFGMGRIVDATAVLELYAKNNPETNLSINLKDDIIEDNNRTYRISKGKSEICPSGSNAEDMDIKTLTSLVFTNTDRHIAGFMRNFNPYMNLMLDL